MGDIIIYLIDTNVLVSIRNRADSSEIYSGLIRLARDGIAWTVRQVFDELKDQGASLQFIQKYRTDFVISAEQQYCAGVREKMEIVRTKAKWLNPGEGGSNPDPADPWLVAVAAHHKYVVVTNERQTSEFKIPAACRIEGIKCRCILGPHFLYEVGLVKTYNPAHISPDAFFAKGEG